VSPSAAHDRPAIGAQVPHLVNQGRDNAPSLPDARWFAGLTRRKLRRSAHRSVTELPERRVVVAASGEDVLADPPRHARATHPQIRTWPTRRSDGHRIAHSGTDPNLTDRLTIDYFNQGSQSIVIQRYKSTAASGFWEEDDTSV
jgi:hypothetical protein